MPPPPPPRKGLKGTQVTRYTHDEVMQQMATMEQLLLQPGVSVIQQNAAMRERLGVSTNRCNVLRQRVRREWLSQDDAERSTNRAVAVRRIMGLLAHARGKLKQRTKATDPVAYEREPNHAACAKYESLLADLQGTRMPIEVRVHHEVSAAVADVIGNLTAEQLQDYLAEYEETQRLAAEYKARQLGDGK